MLQDWLDSGASPRDVSGAAVGDVVLERLLGDKCREIPSSYRARVTIGLRRN
jgi:hypothetical protein